MFSNLCFAIFDAFGQFLLGNASWLAMAMLAVLAILLLLVIVTQCQVWRAEKVRKSPEAAPGLRWKVRS